MSLNWGMQCKVLGCILRDYVCNSLGLLANPGGSQWLYWLTHTQMHTNCSKSIHIVTAFLSQHTRQAAKAHSVSSSKPFFSQPFVGCKVMVQTQGYF